MSNNKNGIEWTASLRRIFSRPIAHRGLFSQELPENSLGAFARGLAKGYSLECDVRLSADGKVYVFHDESTLRLTGVPGDFESLGASSIDALRLQLPPTEKGAERTQERVPLFSDLLQLLGQFAGPSQRDQVLVVELKSFDACGWHKPGGLEDALVEVLHLHGAANPGLVGRIALKSFNPLSVLYLKEKEGKGSMPWPCGLIACDMAADGDFAFLNAKEAQSLATLQHPAAKAADFFSYGIGSLTSDLVSGTRKPLMTWTIRTAGQLAKANKLAQAVVFEEAVAHLIAVTAN